MYLQYQLMKTLQKERLRAAARDHLAADEIAFDFRVTPQIMLSGIAFAAALGAVGGLFPARTAANKQILVALRDI